MNSSKNFNIRRTKRKEAGTINFKDDTIQYKPRGSHRDEKSLILEYKAEFLNFSKKSNF